MKKLLLIDGHSILNRAFFGLPDLTNGAGLHTNAVYGFLNILFKLLDTEEPDALIVAFDVHAPTFRHKMYTSYKGTRKPMAEELRQQVPMMKQMLTAMGVPIVEKEGLEADDILGTIAKRGEAEGMEVTIVSGDRDLLQLATDHTRICIPKTKKTGTEIENYYAADVKERYGVTPKEFIDVKALWGDTSDNIPGVPGIGEKTATAIIAAYGSIENAHDHVEELKPPRASKNLAEYYDQAVLSKELATINVDGDVDCDPKDVSLGNLYTPEAFLLCKEWDFKNFLGHFEVDVPKNEAEEHFHVIASEAEAEDLARALKERAAAEAIDLGCFWLTEKGTGRGDWLALALSDGRDSWMLPGEALPSEENAAEKTAMEKAAAEKAAEPEKAPSGETFLNMIESIIGPFAGESAKEGTEQEKRKETEQGTEKGIRICARDLKALAKYLRERAEKADAGGSASERSALSPENGFDVEVAAYLLNPLKSTYLLEDVAQEYLALMIPSYIEVFGKNSVENVWKEKAETVVKYACYQAYTAAAAPKILEERLAERGMDRLYRDMELPLVFTLADMETEGIAMDGEALKEYGEKLAVRIRELEQSIYEQAGHAFNINSPKQLGTVLFEELHLPGGKKTKTGYSTAADVLEKLAPDVPLVADILSYRQLAKLKSTYADGLVGCLAEDGRVHSTFQQTVTATGRISSTDPNLQNIPIRIELGRQIRKVFHPKDGYVFVDADYSQIELRVLAHMSGDENLIEAYRQNRDIHRSTASLVFHTPFEEVTDLQRRNAKAVNFGIVYGISSFGLSQDLSITRKEAQKYIDDYFAAYPKMKEFLDGLVRQGKETGEVKTMFGRIRPIPELSSNNYMQRQFGERVAMNSPIQGTAADIIKIAMVRVHDRLEREGLSSRLILQVHDELLIEAKKEELAQVEQILSEEMKGAADLAVPLEIDMHTGETWYDAK